MQYITLFKLCEILVDAPAGCTLQFSTDLPGNVMTVRMTDIIPATSGRHPHRMELPGSCQGKLYQLKVFPTGGVGMGIFGAKVYARPLGPPVIPWAWYTVPGIFPTQDDWSEMRLPIETTPDNYIEMKLPIETTPDNYTSMALPIEPTGETYASMKLPIRETPVVPDWVSMPVDE